jgi:hypothetical protein
LSEDQSLVKALLQLMILFILIWLLSWPEYISHHNELYLIISFSFFASGEVNITQENVQELMAAADMLQLREVVVGCTQFLKNELHFSNAIGIYRQV